MVDSGVVIFNRFPAQKAGRRKKRKREGERKLCDGELTAEYRPDLKEKAPSVRGLGQDPRCPLSSPLTLLFLFLGGEEGCR